MRVKEVPSQERLHQLFDYQDGQLIYRQRAGSRRKGTIAGSKFYDSSYVRISVDGISYTKHRLVYQYHHGNLLTENIIDHIDRDPGNNAIENLRVVTKGQNNLNSKVPSHNTHGYKGVSKSGKNKYMARIKNNYQHEYLGTYNTPEEAHQAYMERLNELY